MPLDPFTRCYDAIAAAFRANAKGRFHLVDWNSSRNPQLDRPTAQDLPEVQLRPTDREIALGARSCSTVVVQRYIVTVTTGSFILGQTLFPLDWLILKLMHALQYSLVNELDLAEDVAVNQISHGILDPAANRNITGWASSWTISVHMSFPAADLEL